MLNFFFLLPAKHDWYFEIDFSLGLAVLILYVIHSFQCTSLLYESIKTKSLNSLLVELNVNACLVNLLNYPVFAIKKKKDAYVSIKTKVPILPEIICVTIDILY